MSRCEAWLALTLAALLMGGCAYRGAAPGVSPNQAAPAGAGATGGASPRSGTAGVPAPVRALVARAEKASQKGHQDAAAAYLERALRIAPRNAALWYNLAVVRYRDGKYALAESLAMKSADLAGRDLRLKSHDWALVAAARRLNGDKAGATEAQSRADKYSSALEAGER